MRPRNDNAPLINERIRCDRLQLITHDGRNLGLVNRDEALVHAQEAGLDLVLIADRGSDGHPIAKIMDFGKALYEKKKQQHEAKKRQHIVEVKELRLSPKIAEHDYQTKMNQGVRFLKEGKHLKVTLVFRGRENATKEERGAEFFDKIQKTFDDAGIGKQLLYEKDAKMPKMWSRVYILKK